MLTAAVFLPLLRLHGWALVKHGGLQTGEGGLTLAALRNSEPELLVEQYEYHRDEEM